MSLTEVLSNKRKWWVQTGPVLRTLRQIPDDSVQCCVTSPPYYKLRAYLPKEHPDKAHELGQEPSPHCGAGGSSYMELRDDLSDEEKAYVMSELIRLGLL